MDAPMDRRRNPDVPRANGERWTDTQLARQNAGKTGDGKLWLWGGLLWGGAALVGIAYGWLSGLL